MRLPEEKTAKKPIETEVISQKVEKKEPKRSKAKEKVGDFFIEHEQVKLVTSV